MLKGLEEKCTVQKSSAVISIVLSALYTIPQPMTRRLDWMEKNRAWSDFVHRPDPDPEPTDQTGVGPNNQSSYFAGH